MQEEKNFGFLGFTFQQSLIRSIVEDRRFGEAIIEVLDSRYFDNNSFKFIVENIKEYYVKYNKIPEYDDLKERVINESGGKEKARVHIDTIEEIRSDERVSHKQTQDIALNFCRQQHLIKELAEINKIIKNGKFEEYEKIETIVQKALQVGILNEDESDVFENADDALKDDYRHPIPTGIVGIDQLLKGGLGRGELGVVLAPTGIGKTTLLTKIANTAYNVGFNVLQIFFEDNRDQIKRKHYTIWTGISSDEQPEHRDRVKAAIKERQDESTGNLKLLKLISGAVTIGELKSKIRKIVSNGFKPDLIVLDYIDCISSDGAEGEEWKGEGAIMRSLESMGDEFNVAIWTATQGNRSSISSDVVTGDQTGGSIKKIQIAHVILSIARTIEQKEQKLATMTLVKSRIGRDGVVMGNCKFDNEFLVINTDEEVSLLGHREERDRQRGVRIVEAIERRQAAGRRQNNDE